MAACAFGEQDDAVAVVQRRAQRLQWVLVGRALPRDVDGVEHRRGDPLPKRCFGPVVARRNRPGDGAQVFWQRRPDQHQVSMALVVGKVDTLLRLGWAAIPARLRPGHHADQPQQEIAHQCGAHAGDDTDPAVPHFCHFRQSSISPDMHSGLHTGFQIGWSTSRQFRPAHSRRDRGGA